MATSARLDESKSIDLSELECLMSLIPDGPIDIGPDVTAVLVCC